MFLPVLASPTGRRAPDHARYLDAGDTERGASGWGAVLADEPERPRTRRRAGVHRHRGSTVWATYGAATWRSAWVWVWPGWRLSGQDFARRAQQRHGRTRTKTPDPRQPLLRRLRSAGRGDGPTTYACAPTMMVRRLGARGASARHFGPRGPTARRSCFRLGRRLQALTVAERGSGDWIRSSIHGDLRHREYAQDRETEAAPLGRDGRRHEAGDPQATG